MSNKKEQDTKEIIKKQYDAEKAKAKETETENVEVETKIETKVDSKDETKEEIKVEEKAIVKEAEIVKDEKESKISLTQKELDQLLSKAKEEAVMKRFKSKAKEASAENKEQTSDVEKTKEMLDLINTVESLKAKVDLAEKTAEKQKITNKLKNNKIKNEDMEKALILLNGLMNADIDEDEAIKQVAETFSNKFKPSIGAISSNKETEEIDGFTSTWNERNPELKIK